MPNSPMPDPVTADDYEGSNPIDARFCPSCGADLPEDRARLYDDLVHDVYRARFACPACGYFGEVIRLMSQPQTGAAQERFAAGDPGEPL